MHVNHFTIIDVTHLWQLTPLYESDINTNCNYINVARNCVIYPMINVFFHMTRRNIIINVFLCIGIFFMRVHLKNFCNIVEKILYHYTTVLLFRYHEARICAIEIFTCVGSVYIGWFFVDISFCYFLKQHSCNYIKQTVVCLG